MPRTTGDINAAPYAADPVPGGPLGALLPAAASMAGLTRLIGSLLLLTAVTQHRPRHTLHGRPMSGRSSRRRDV